MTTEFEKNLALDEMRRSIESVLAWYTAEIDATDELGVNGYCMCIGTGGSACLAKWSGEKLGYFGKTFLRGSPLTIQRYVDNWNKKYGGSEHAAHVAGPQEIQHWFESQIETLLEALEKTKAKK